MATRVTLGGRFVVSNGTLVITGGKDASVTPLVAGDSPLTFKFSFERKEGEAASYRTVITDKAMLISLINFDAADGLTVTNPIHVGTIANRDLDLAFSAYSIGKGPTVVRVLSYTFTLAGEQDV